MNMAIYPQNWWKVVLDSLNVALDKFIPLGWVKKFYRVSLKFEFR